MYISIDVGTAMYPPMGGMPRISSGLTVFVPSRSPSILMYMGLNLNRNSFVSGTPPPRMVRGIFPPHFPQQSPI